MKMTVVNREGGEKEIDALEGWRAMEVIRDHGMEDRAFAIKAECGGAMACGTCHVHVDGHWLGKLVPPSEEETNTLLDNAFDVRENSRLSCQILMTEELDGLKVTLAAGTEP